MFSRSFFSCAALLLAVLLLPLSAAHADTYLVTALSPANNIGVYGIDGAGDVVLRDLAPNASVCGQSLICYITYSAAGGVSVSASIPSLAYDNGTACSPAVPMGSTVFDARCNNGHEAFGADIPTGPTTYAQGVFDGPDPLLDLVQEGPANQLVLNARGDIAWTDGASETIYRAVDVSAPEPASLALLGTGALGAVGVLRRRFTQHT